MRCPFCNADNTKVIDTRISSDGLQVKRRRECLVCHERFTTFEQPDLNIPSIIKSDGIRELFNEEKLRVGMRKALEKRPVGAAEIDKSINRIEKRLRATGEREIRSRFVGNLVMEELAKLDPVAYIRFASVYLSFDKVTDFSKAIKKLELDN